MLNVTEFETKYENEINAIAKAEGVAFIDAREMLVYTCRQRDKGLHTEGAAMDFGRNLQDGFDYAVCLEDFSSAIGEELAEA